MDQMRKAPAARSICSDILTQLRLATDRQTDGHQATALEQRRASKNLHIENGKRNTGFHILYSKT